MNAFELAPENSGRWLMDLPGYGFAKVSKAEQAKWATMLSTYIEERENLVSVILLIDGAVGPTALDLQTVEWLESLSARSPMSQPKPTRSNRRSRRSGELN